MIESSIRIDTPDSTEYHYFPIAKTLVNFSVKAKNDARICLRTNLSEDSEAYEIIIGGMENNTSYIRKCKTDVNLAEAQTVGIISDEDACLFWIQWYCDGRIDFGVEDVESSILSYCDKEPFLINYIGFSTAHGATGEWILEGCGTTALAVRDQLLETLPHWVDYEPEVGLPRNAVPAEEEGPHVGRGRHRRSLTPGAVRGPGCLLAWGGAAHEKSEFQVLCAPGAGWVWCSRGALPLNALPAGETEDGMALFVGRVMHEGAACVGKVQPNHQVCYVPLRNREVAYTEYEVLVVNEYGAHECVGR